MDRLQEIRARLHAATQREVEAGIRTVRRDEPVAQGVTKLER